jgi:hypothetical protein
MHFLLKNLSAAVHSSVVYAKIFGGCLGKAEVIMSLKKKMHNLHAAMPIKGPMSGVDPDSHAIHDFLDSDCTNYYNY